MRRMAFALAALALAGCGGSPARDVEDALAEWLAGNASGVELDAAGCVDRHYMQRGLALFQCVVVEPDRDEPVRWNVAYDAERRIVVDASRAE